MSKTTILGCYVYAKTYRWNLWRGVGESLCSLQKMDQRVLQQKFYGPVKGNKINTTPNADPF